MPSLTEEICLLLQELQFGTYPIDPSDVGGSIFLAALPAAPDEAIAVARYAGPESGSLLGYDEPSFQIRVRGPKHDAGVPEERAQAIYDALHGLRSRYLPGGTWLVHLIGANAGPVPMGQDTHQRTEYVVNLRAEVRRPTPNRQ
jgi:hypothetical protein